MKNVMRIVTVALTVVLMAAAFVAPASASVAVDQLSGFGQLTFEVYEATTAPDVEDGIVSEGEYGEPLASYTPNDPYVSIDNWTENTANPLTREELLEVAPEKMTIYATFDEEYLYMALEVVKASHYSIASTYDRIWSAEDWTLRLCLDAYADYREPGAPWTYSEAMAERFCVCVGLTSIGGAPEEPLALIGENASFQMYSAWESIEGVGATRNDDTQTTTYEIKAAWANIWGDGETGDVPEIIPFISSYALADERYPDRSPYETGLGSFRWSNQVDREGAIEAGIEPGSTGVLAGVGGQNIPHIMKLIRNNDGEDDNNETGVGETNAATEAVTDAATEAVTDAATEAVTDATTDAATEATTEATTKAPAATEKKGCGSVIGFSAVALITAAAAVVVLKKKD